MGFMNLAEPTEASPRLVQGLGPRQAASVKLCGSLFEVCGDFRIEVRVQATPPEQRDDAFDGTGRATHRLIGWQATA
jgi:hypothetical protein